MKAPFLTMSIQKNTVTMDEYSIPNIVSIEKITHAPSMTDRTQPPTTAALPENDSIKDSTPNEVHDSHTDKDEYVVDRKEQNIGKKEILCYVLRWYSYGPKDDTVELAHHIAPQFLIRYWKRNNRKKNLPHYTTG